MMVEPGLVQRMHVNHGFEYVVQHFLQTNCNYLGNAWLNLPVIATVSPPKGQYLNPPSVVSRSTRFPVYPTRPPLLLSFLSKSLLLFG